MAPVTALTHELIKNNEVDVLVAATTKEELLFLDELECLDVNLHPCTDDGSYGFEGFASNCLSSLLEDSTYDYAFVCGPEIMMIGTFLLFPPPGFCGRGSWLWG